MSKPSSKRPKYDKLVGKTFLKEVLLLCLFGIALPTGDVLSDGLLIIQLYVDTTQEFRCLSDGNIISARYFFNETDYIGIVERVRDGDDDCSDGSDERGKKIIPIIEKHMRM